MRNNATMLLQTVACLTKTTTLTENRFYLFL
uniref:Uncharacterized protein n=1 Tax=Anguilla anguilla TaxID=7936 RepID=A0A0E9Q5A1_ANGAN